MSRRIRKRRVWRRIVGERENRGGGGIIIRMIIETPFEEFHGVSVALAPHFSIQPPIECS